MNIHLLGLPWLKTHKQFLSQAQMQKIIAFPEMMKGYDYNFIHYGGEGSEIEAELVQVFSENDYHKTFGSNPPRENEQAAEGNLGDHIHTIYYENVKKELVRRVSPGDVVVGCDPHHSPICDFVVNHFSNTVPFVENGCGYIGSYAPWRVYESHFRMSMDYGVDIHNGRPVWVGPETNFWVIPHGCNQEELDYKVKKENYYFFIARWIAAKGCEWIIRFAEDTGQKVIVAGGGEEWDWSGNPNIEIVGYVDVEQRRKLYANAKCTLMPSRYAEPFGFVALESMFSGTPVITTDYGAFPETVCHGLTGYRCRTYEQFVTAALEAPSTIDSSNCRKWAMDNFSYKAIAPMYDTYLQHITGNLVQDINSFRKKYPRKNWMDY
tara:strand:+ start:1317 stop:2453 length:1137 start_codon:yes stop_codon:yes gene_type:complete